MKKIIAILLSVLLITSLLSACGDGSPDESKSGDPAGGSSATSSGIVQGDTQEEKGSTPENQITFEELTVVDNDECSIKIKAIDPNNLWGYSLKVELENKSADKNYMFSLSSASIDGLQSDPFYASEVASGKKSADSISFSDSALEENGIAYTDIELTFRVYDSNDWSADAVAEETVHVYPYGKDKAELFERAPQDSDIVIVDNEYVTVTVISFEEDIIWGYTVNLFLQNKTDTEIMFTADDVSVNGYMADPFWSTSVMPGKCAFSSMSWSDTTLEESGITEIEEIEFALRAYDYNNWMADDLTNEVITLHP